MSIVIEDAVRRFEAGNSPPPVYIYCSRNAAEPERYDPAAIISSVVRQLSCAEPGLPLLPPVIEKYERKGQGFSSRGLQIEESCELITNSVEHYSMTTIVIDALDECDPEKREMLLDGIESLLQNSSLGLVKVFLSSRDDQDIVCTLRDYPHLDLVSSRKSGDIEAFVREETDKLLKKRRLLRNSHAKEALKILINDSVSRGADGMFRWASLQLEMLCTMKLDQDVRARLGRLPPKLEQLYLEAYENNLLKYPGEVGQSIISNIMKWLLCAQRQMKSSEFCSAVTMYTVSTEELTKEHVLDLCHNFVVFDNGFWMYLVLLIFRCESSSRSELSIWQIRVIPLQPRPACYNSSVHRTGQLQRLSCNIITSLIFVGSCIYCGIVGRFPYLCYDFLGQTLPIDRRRKEEKQSSFRGSLSLFPL